MKAHHDDGNPQDRWRHYHSSRIAKATPVTQARSAGGRERRGFYDGATHLHTQHYITHKLHARAHTHTFFLGKIRAHIPLPTSPLPYHAPHGTDPHSRSPALTQPRPHPDTQAGLTERVLVTVASKLLKSPKAAACTGGCDIVDPAPA